MRPYSVREIFRWRWAPSVALVAGSLAFVALALLLIPAPPREHGRAIAAFMPDSRLASPPRTAFNASQPNLDVVAARVDPESAGLATATAPLPSLPLTPLPSLPLTALAGAPAAAPPDFSANIADRGDRPQGPAR